jgi:hypothetical protein
MSIDDVVNVGPVPVPALPDPDHCGVDWVKGLSLGQTEFWRVEGRQRLAAIDRCDTDRKASTRYHNRSSGPSRMNGRAFGNDDEHALTNRQYLDVVVADDFVVHGYLYVRVGRTSQATMSLSLLPVGQGVDSAFDVSQHFESSCGYRIPIF